MSHVTKKAVISLIVIIFIISLVPVSVCARESIDIQQQVSLNVYCVHNNIPVEGITFELYYVAMMDENGSFCLTGEFQDYPVDVNNLDSAGWRGLTATLINYVRADGIPPINLSATNAQGVVSFPSEEKTLYPGLYLVTAQPAQGETYTYYTEPFMIALPAKFMTGDGLTYDVSVQAKLTPEENPQNPGEITTCRKVLKIWTGDTEEIRPEEITIDLLRNGDIYDTVVLNAQNNWRYTWNDLPEFDHNGLKYEWGLVEKETEDYTVLVCQEGITFTVTNTFAPETDGDVVRREVHKNWDDKGYENKRPKEITIYLRGNNEIYDTQILNQGNGWMYIWNDLPKFSDDGAEIKWTVSEEEMSEYVADIVQKGEYIIITNSIRKPTLPQTGMLWWPVPVLAAAGLMMLAIGSFLRRKENV